MAKKRKTRAVRKTKQKLTPKIIQDDVDSTRIKVVAKLDVFKFAIVLGILSSVGIIIISLWALGFGTGQNIINCISQFYFGFNLTSLGILLGAGYGFADGFIGGLIFSWLYNKLI